MRDEERDDFDRGDSGDELLLSATTRLFQLLDGLRDALLDDTPQRPGSDGDRLMGFNEDDRSAGDGLTGSLRPEEIDGVFGCRSLDDLDGVVSTRSLLPVAADEDLLESGSSFDSSSRREAEELDEQLDEREEVCSVNFLRAISGDGIVRCVGFLSLDGDADGLLRCSELSRLDELRPSALWSLVEGFFPCTINLNRLNSN